jgi:hypothetical protein
MNALASVASVVLSVKEPASSTVWPAIDGGSIYALYGGLPCGAAYPESFDGFCLNSSRRNLSECLKNSR